mgnify:FL=1
MQEDKKTYGTEDGAISVSDAEIDANVQSGENHIETPGEENKLAEEDNKLTEENNKHAEIDTNIQSGGLEEDILDSVVITQEDAMEDISDSLRLQVQQQLEDQKKDQLLEDKKSKRKKRLKKALIITGSILACLLILILLLVGTKGGRNLLYKLAGNYISGQVNNDDDTPIDPVTVPDDNTGNEQVQTPPDDQIPQSNVAAPRSETYVTNYLIFGIEEIEGASNTDSMMIASINTRDKTVKLTSLMRDTYIIVDGNPNKLNAVYAKDGADKLVSVIEQNYHIKLDGYAHINFSSFEKIIAVGRETQLRGTTKEANYLNHTNYISNPANRNVHAGWNVLNGNQALGYCRVRRVATLGGVSDDYGRTLRQRRVLTAIFDKYKSKGLLNLIPIMNDCLGYVYTDLTSSQFENGLEAFVENGISTMETIRIPKDGAFEYYKDYNGVNDPLVLDWDKNLKALYQFIVLDTEELAQQNLAAYKN